VRRIVNEKGPVTFEAEVKQEFEKVTPNVVIAHAIYYEVLECPNIVGFPRTFPFGGDKPLRV
jgi:hypothetical protein